VARIRSRSATSFAERKGREDAGCAGANVEDATTYVYADRAAM